MECVKLIKGHDSAVCSLVISNGKKIFEKKNRNKCKKTNMNKLFSCRIYFFWFIYGSESLEFGNIRMCSNINRTQSLVKNKHEWIKNKQTWMNKKQTNMNRVRALAATKNRLFSGSYNIIKVKTWIKQKQTWMKTKINIDLGSLTKFISMYSNNYRKLWFHLLFSCFSGLQFLTFRNLWK